MIDFINTRIELVNINTGNSYVNADIANSVNAIGEKKRITFDYSVASYSGSIEDYVFHINLAMFMPKGVVNPINKKGNIYWQGRIPAVISGPSDIICDIVSEASFIQKESFKNYSVKISIIDSFSFQLVVEFFNTFDVLGYMTNEIALLNVERFLKDRYNNPNQLVTTGNSIYTDTNYDGRIYLYAEQAEDPTDYGSIETLFGDYKVRFYGGHPFVYGTEPDISFKYYVGSTQVQTLNTVYDTKVKATIYCPDYTPSLWIMVWKKNNIDNTIDFVQNGELEVGKIQAGQADQDLLKGPYTLPTDNGTGGYDATFYINSENINIGDELYMVAMVYNPSGDIVSSFIAKTPQAGDQVPYAGAGLTFSGSLTDYNKEYTGNDLECVIEERMLSKVLITYPLNQYANDIYNRLGVIIPNNILTYLTKIRFKIYEDASTSQLPYQSISQQILNYLDEREMVKQKNNPSIFSGQTSEFAAVVGTEYIQLFGYWRNRYEANIQCIRSTIGGIDYGSKLTTQYWGGKTLIVEWQLEFFYDNIDSPFTDLVTYRQQIRVKDYDTDVQITAQESENEAKEFRCLDDELKYQTEFTPPDAYDYKVINNIEVNPGGISTIEEADSWTSSVLTQKTTTKIPISTQESSISQSVSNKQLFEIDSAQLTANTYKISSIVKRILPLIP